MRQVSVGSTQGMYPEPDGGGVYSYSYGAGRGGAWAAPGRGRGKGIGKGARGKGVDIDACGTTVASCDTEKLACFEPCAEDDRPPQRMTLVGDGRGDYIQETNYKFVGAGAGQFIGDIGETAPRKKINTSNCLVAAGGFCCAVVFMALVFVCLPSTSIAPPGQEQIPGGTMLSYNCQEDYASWQEKWPEGKKTWCCQHSGMACEMADAAATVHTMDQEFASSESTSAPSSFGQDADFTPKPAFPSTAAQTTTAAATSSQAGQAAAAQPPAAGVSQQPPMGDPSQQPGLLPVQSAAAPAAAAPAAAEVPPPSLRFPPPTPQAAAVATSPPEVDPPLHYACKIDADNGPDEWSQEQKVWCCQHTGKGCSPTMALSFNCSAALQSWRKEWSEAKKAWCCQNKHLGCPVPEAKALTDQPASAAPAAAAIATVVNPLQPASQPFAGFQAEALAEHPAAPLPVASVRKLRAALPP